MSETTSESGQAHLADEPSMEDILDSIRKIIADDEQTMDIAPPHALEAQSADESISEIEPSLSPSNLVSETILGPSTEFDENSVFKSLRDDSSKGADDGIDETVDLDIEALLSGAETPPENLDNLSVETYSEEDDDDLLNMLDIKIPEQVEERISVGTTSEAVKSESAPTDVFDLSDVVSEALLESNLADTDLESTDQIDLQKDGDDSLFDELEGLLTTESEVETHLDEENLAVNSEFADSDDFKDIESLLDGDMNDPQEESSADTNPQTFDADSPAFHSDEADMDMVKSLMADLTEPDTESDTEHDDETDSHLEQDTAASSDSSSEEEDIPVLDDLLQEAMEEMSSGEPRSDNAVSSTEPTSQEEGYDDVEFDDSDMLDEIINMSLEAERAEEETEGEDNLQIPELEEGLSSAEGMTFEEMEKDPLDSLVEYSEIVDESETEVEAPVTAQSLISSLMEIAGAAEHDADEAEATLAAAEQDRQASENTKNTVSETSEAEVAETSHPETPLKETADMPKAAVNQDRILDDVSGEAATSAFASLNNMVEEKAIKAERGDRIGDLVMEALRPMLKEWLDEHLNDIVERAVTKEVQRISSGK